MNPYTALVGRPAAVGLEFDHFVVRHVVAGTNQVVHAGIDQHQLLAARVLAGKHGGEENPRAPHQEPSRLEDDAQAGLPGNRENRVDKTDRIERGFVPIADAQAASDVQVAKRMLNISQFIKEKL